MSYFKLAAAVSAIALLSATAAVAADPMAPVYDAPMAMADTGFDWSGFYVGVIGGGGFGENHANLSVDYDPSDGTFEDRQNIDFIDISGGLLGVEAGYNFQADSIVFGLEADLSIANITGADDDEDPIFNNGVATSYDTLASVRGRIGVAADRLLAFATAGLAYAGGTDSYTFTYDGGTPNDPVDHDFSEIGYTVGAGVEYAITDNLSIKGEYLYSNFGDGEEWDVNEANGGPVFGDDSFTFETISHSVHTVRVGLNLSF